MVVCEGSGAGFPKRRSIDQGKNHFLKFSMPQTQKTCAYRALISKVRQKALPECDRGRVLQIN
jgi:hypothetical protein